MTTIQSLKEQGKDLAEYHRQCTHACILLTISGVLSLVGAIVALFAL